MLFYKIKSRLINKCIFLVQISRIIKYKLLSSCKIVGNPHLHQPVQFVGKGAIYFQGSVNIGVFPSPYFLSGYSYIEARGSGSKVVIGNGTWINNNFVVISEHKSITIGENVRIGTSVEIFDSNFHGLQPDLRSTSNPEESASVIIEDNVFIGSSVKILKGVTIGRDSVIACGSIVTRSIPAGVIAGGIPAKTIKQL